MLEMLASFSRTFIKFTTNFNLFSLKPLICVFVYFFTFNGFLFLEMENHCFSGFLSNIAEFYIFSSYVHLSFINIVL